MPRFDPETGKPLPKFDPETGMQNWSDAPEAPVLSPHNVALAVTQPVREAIINKYMYPFELHLNRLEIAAKGM